MRFYWHQARLVQYTVRMATTFTPNAEQHAAITWRGGHALVLAGAGTGKTFTIIERTKGLLAEGVNPNRLLLLTFTRRAAGEMRQRIGSDHAGLFAGTFHAWAIALMHQRPDLGVQPNMYTIIDRDDQLQIMRRLKAQRVRKGELGLFPSPAQTLDFIGYARSTLITTAEYLERFTRLPNPQAKFVIQMAEAYRAYAEQRRYLDFDGILERVAVALTENNDLAARIGNLYDEVLIDEAQDLNPLQWSIIDALVAHTRVFMVGDDAQSIYGFRGADFESIHSFTSRVPSGTVLRLEQNYRSTQAILDVANAVLQQSPLAYNKQLTGVRGDGEKPTMHHFSADFDEANWIADTIIAAHNEGETFTNNKVLVRTMRIARRIEASFVEKEIPYIVVGGTSLFQLAHTKDLLALVRATLNIRDELAWMRYLTLFRGIGEVTADRVLERLLTCNTIGEARAVIEQVLANRAMEVLAPVREIARNATNPGAAVRGAVKALTKVFEHEYRQDWDRRKPDLELMASLAERRNDLDDFVTTYTLDPITGTAASRPSGDAVLLITVHSAKGLEGKRVFVPHAQFGVYPHVHSMGSRDEVEEERRIFYVAVTRAQDQLLLSTAVSSFAGFSGFQTMGTAEPFVEYIPDELIDHVGMPAPALGTQGPAPDLDDWG